MYRCMATSVEAFVQQVAVAYIRHGYLWYIDGFIWKKKKNVKPAVLEQKLVEVDRKLIQKYGIDISERARRTRKKKGQANFQYIRHGRFFVLMATEGEKEKFEDEEGDRIKHVYHAPIRYGGYSISYRNGHPAVRIGSRRYKEMRTQFLDLATSRSAENLRSEFSRLRFQPFRVVKSQLWRLVDEVNEARKQTGYETLPYTVLGPVLRRVRGPLVVPSGLEECRLVEAA